MSDDRVPFELESEHDRSEAIIARAMRFTTLVSVCLRAARHAARGYLPAHDLVPEREEILREAFGDPDPEKWAL